MLDDQRDIPHSSGLPVATAPEPPTLPPALAPVHSGASHPGWRLTTLVVVIVALAAALAGSQAAALASTRTAAYPQPAVSVSVGGTTPYRVGTAIQFSANPTAGRQLGYSWDFGDEQSGTGPSVSHTFSNYGTAVVSVTATDPIGQHATAHQQISVLPLPPTACFTDTPDPQDPLFVQFDGSCSSGAQISYAWDFGDGSTSQEGPQTGHEFALGTFTVTLSVTDVANQTARQSASVTINIPAPQATFTYQQTTNGGYYACYSFDASSSTGYHLSYNWNMGDGYSGYGPTPSDCYYTGSTYTITLTVTDGLGRSASTSRQISL